jgi:secreted trypsin-like serine protease
MKTKSLLATLLIGSLLTAGFAPSSLASPGPSPRIIGGSGASISDVPWQVGLLRNTSNNSNFQDQFCGGSLINTQWVLTAAHCVVDNSNRVMSASELVVLPGVDFLSSVSRNGRVSVSRIYVHPGYSTYANEDDVALLRLSRAVALQPGSIEIISLPFQKSASTWPAANTSALISGWGSVSSNSEAPSYPAELMKATVRVSSNPTDELCGDYPADEYDRISMLCAGDIPGYLIDTCWGDSGGPLAINDGSRYVLAGVTSWGYGCAESNYPGIYARVTTYLSWIDTYVDFPAPRFSSVSPSSGSIGQTVTISGTDLNLVEDVYFGDVEAEFSVVSSRQLTAVVPASASTSRIRLVSASGISESRSNFAVVIPIPEVSSFSPSRSSIGATVRLTGKNLGTASQVLIGSVEAEIVDGSVSATSLSFVVPVGASSNRVTVVNDYGSATSRSTLTLVVPTPEISSFSPSRSSIGATVRLTGRNLGTASQVLIGSVEAEIVDGSVSATSLSFVVPVGATSNRVTVVNDYGSTTSRSRLTVR